MASPAPTPESERLLERITAFSDGVIAIAITLLVLNIEVPKPSAGESLSSALVDIRPTLFTWLLSFAVIGGFWFMHHGVLARMAGADAVFTSLNLVFLGLVALVPFSSALIAEYGDESLATAIYALNVAVGIALTGVLGQVAKARGLLRPDAAEPKGLAATIPAGVFFLSIPIAFVDPTAGQITWALVAVSDPIEGFLRRALFATR